MFEEIGRGEFEIVQKAVEFRSGAAYAAKEFFSAKEKQEAQNLSETTTLCHVSHVSAHDRIRLYKLPY